MSKEEATEVNRNHKSNLDEKIENNRFGIIFLLTILLQTCTAVISLSAINIGSPLLLLFAFMVPGSIWMIMLEVL